MELQPGDFSLRAKYQGNVVAAVVSTAEVVREHQSGSASPKTMAKAQVLVAQAAVQRVEDNAFHLGYFAR
jgi:hypothetical protein